ncbi:2Fe-2S iron-sulfur cluster-binding protein [Rubrobacter aplysinae]|uniref:2Fe-2S iron-sulfur cluster-binding protein n=1 Tax=Rubrobacter aplysinae TaxID=909625 RepID=UPI00064C0DB8|nr:2Fe-2S iron-sulfur cluster-binding protein [Rubrobacter aplysinae]
MPKLEIDGVGGVGTIEVEDGRRLVLAVEQDAGVDIMHRCGGNAKCTTCRVEFVEGEPERMTQAELEALEKREELGNFRLSCQIPCDHDMKVRPLMRVSQSEADSPGAEPATEITPEPEWIQKPE